MRAHQIMTRSVITIAPDSTILEAANTMLQHHVSGLPVVDAAGQLVGIVSEGDFIRRSEIGTQRKRGRWLKFLLGAGLTATDYVHEHGRKVSEVMTTDPITVVEDATLEQIVTSMETNGVKRLPVMRGDKLVGIVSRANLLQAGPHSQPHHRRDREERLVPVRAQCHRARRHRPSQRRDHRREFAASGDGGYGEHRGREKSSRPSVLDRHHVGDVSGIARRRRDGKGRLGRMRCDLTADSTRGAAGQRTQVGRAQIDRL